MLFDLLKVWLLGFSILKPRCLDFAPEDTPSTPNPIHHAFTSYRKYPDSSGHNSRVEVTSQLVADDLANDPSIEWQIKAEAKRLGFVFCGITTADQPPHYIDYQNWIEQGNHGEMAYLARQKPKRGDLNQVLVGAKSVVVVGLNYSQPKEVHAGSDPNQRGDFSPQGMIARYARFDDYHQTIWHRLELLLESIQQINPQIQGRVYCDTGPITERDLAMRAGIGWIGKHTNLIHRKLGNWFFLGELILDIALIADQPETTHCGTCTRCIPACPTGAIKAPYHLDARLCISYLTIELKGAIPIELRPLIGNRIYGCDDCLAVCPWNRFAVASDDPAVQPRSDLQSPELIPLLSLTDDDFREKFANSPIKRTKRRGLLRNVCVALGNSGDDRALPALINVRDNDHEPLVREHAGWAIERIRNAEV